MAKTLHEQLTDPNTSAFRRYQSIALGTASIWYLVKYELIMFFFSGLPGAVGLVTRKYFYPKILGTVGRNVIFGQGISIRHGEKIHLGDNVVVDDFVNLDAKGENNVGITIGADTIVSRNVGLACKNANITVGSHCTIGAQSLVQSVDGSDVIVGDYVLIAAFVYIIGCGPYGTEEKTVPFKKQGIQSKGGIRIQDNVWIGSGVQVMDGVSIGSGSIVASQAVVTKNISEYSVARGIPAKVVAER